MLSVRSVALSALATALFTGCAAVPATTVSPSPTPSASAAPTPTPSRAPTASPASSTASPSPATSPTLPEIVQIEPAAIIEMAGSSGLIWVTTDGQTVWAVDNGAVLRIDAQTNAVQRLDAPVQLDDTTLTIADDGLWVTRWSGGRLYRLDPQTGAVLLEVKMPAVVRVAFIGDDMWVGREDTGSMAKVDLVTGLSGASVVDGAYGVAGLGDLWFVDDSPTKVVRVDGSTGGQKATIDFQGETNCSITGSFPDNAWTACFGREVIERTAARLDPNTNTVATVVTLPPTHGGSVIAIEGEPWFLGSFEGSDGEPFAGLLHIDRETQSIDRFLALAGADPDVAVVTAGALWVPDEAGHRILKVDFADLKR